MMEQNKYEDITHNVKHRSGMTISPDLERIGRWNKTIVERKQVKTRVKNGLHLEMKMIHKTGQK